MFIGPEWEIEWKPNRENYLSVDATLKPGAVVHRYPFQALQKVGSSLSLIGIDEKKTRDDAYAYAKRRGWKIIGKIERERNIETGEAVNLWLTLTRVG